MNCFIDPSSRQKRIPSSKSSKRLIESQKLAETRREATKKYQHAKTQRSKALEKTALTKAENVAFDDPQVSQGYDLWNAKDEKHGKEKKRQNI